MSSLCLSRNSIWYRLYSDNWLEQGNEFTGVLYDYTAYTVNFAKPFMYAPPQVITQAFMSVRQDPNGNANIICDHQPTYFQFWKFQGGNPSPDKTLYIYWWAFGY